METIPNYTNLTVGADLKNFLKGMETPPGAVMLGIAKITSKTSLKGWKHR